MALPKRVSLLNVELCDEALRLDPDSTAPASHREAPLHESAALLLPQLRPRQPESTPVARAPPSSPLCVWPLGAASRKDATLKVGRRTVARGLIHEADEPAGPPVRASARRLLAAEGAAVGSELLDQLEEEEAGREAAEAAWDAFAGNCISGCGGLVGTSNAPSEYSSAHFLCAVGESLDSLQLWKLQPAVHRTPLYKTAVLLGEHELPTGRRIYQVANVSLGADNLGLARSDYWLHYVRMRLSGLDDSTWAADSESALSCAGICRLATRPMHAALNPRVLGEVATVLESGSVLTMRLDWMSHADESSQSRHAGLVPGVPNSPMRASARRHSWALCWQPARIVSPGLPWQSDPAAWRPPVDASLNWSSLEWGEHPRMLYVANRAHLYRMDLRVPPELTAGAGSLCAGRGPCLLFDLHSAPWKTLDPISALATPQPHSKYGDGLGHGSGALVALASQHSVLLLDTRCLRAPREQWTLPPAVAEAPQPRSFLSFCNDGASVQVIERGTGRSLTFSANAPPAAFERPPALPELAAAPPPPTSLDPERVLFRTLACEEARQGGILPLAGAVRLSPSHNPFVLIALSRNGGLRMLAPRPDVGEETSGCRSDPSQRTADPSPRTADSARGLGTLASEFPLEPRRALAVNAMLSCEACRGEGRLANRPHTCGLFDEERRNHCLSSERGVPFDACAPTVKNQYGMTSVAPEQLRLLLERAGKAIEVTAGGDVTSSTCESHAIATPRDQSSVRIASADSSNELEARLSALWGAWSDVHSGGGGSAPSLAMPPTSSARPDAPHSLSLDARLGAPNLNALLGAARPIGAPRSQSKPQNAIKRRRKSSGF